MNLCITAGQIIQITGKAKQSGNRPVYMADPNYQIVKSAVGD